MEFDGLNVGELDKGSLKTLRRRMQMIFQDPYASLNPRMTVYDTLAEPLLLHKIIDRAGLDGAIKSLMDNVVYRALSQRNTHTNSLAVSDSASHWAGPATKPEFIVADEPVSALDVTIQAQILDLLKDLKDEYGLTMLFVSHDLAVIRQIADSCMPCFIEENSKVGNTSDVFNSPQSDYTQRLLAAIPGKSAA